MRQIKFRVWDEYSQELFNIEDFYYFEEQGIHNSSECCLMQFTGILDKNGKEIYEGDCVQFTQHLFNTPEEKFPVKIKEVKWLDWEGKWNLRETNAGESNFEVIGNIYENPELLNNK